MIQFICDNSYHAPCVYGAALLCANRVGRFFILNDFSDTDDFADACHVVVFIKRNIIIVLVH